MTEPDQLNEAILDLWELCNANAPIEPGDCRTIGKTLVRRIGTAQAELAALRAQVAELAKERDRIAGSQSVETDAEFFSYLRATLIAYNVPEPVATEVRNTCLRSIALTMQSALEKVEAGKALVLAVDGWRASSDNDRVHEFDELELVLAAAKKAGL